MSAVDLEIAKTVLQQLGGNKFAVMTGAKDFVACTRSLQFALPSRGTKDRICKVKVTLEFDDTYTMEFFKRLSGGVNLQIVHTDSDIFCDGLQDNFTRRTGLRTHL